MSTGSVEMSKSSVTYQLINVWLSGSLMPRHGLKVIQHALVPVAQGRASVDLVAEVLQGGRSISRHSIPDHLKSIPLFRSVMQAFDCLGARLGVDLTGCLKSMNFLCVIASSLNLKMVLVPIIFQGVL